MLGKLRLSHGEPYDPKQRIIGGIVLFLLMMLFYFTLKLLLGISATGADYALRPPLPDEVVKSLPAAVTPGQGEDIPPEQTVPKYEIVHSFLFLGLDGRPMGDEEFQFEPVDVSMEDLGSGGKRWMIQAASFREIERANKMIADLSARQIQASVEKSGKWYVVRLAPQTDRRLAEQQLNQLRVMGIRGILLQR